MRNHVVILAKDDILQIHIGIEEYKYRTIYLSWVQVLYMEAVNEYEANLITSWFKFKWQSLRASTKEAPTIRNIQRFSKRLSYYFMLQLDCA